MLVISALKQVANAATNAVHSATGNVTGHAHSNSGESTRPFPSLESERFDDLSPTCLVRMEHTSGTVDINFDSPPWFIIKRRRGEANDLGVRDHFYDKLKLLEYLLQRSIGFVLLAGDIKITSRAIYKRLRVLRIFNRYVQGDVTINLHSNIVALKQLKLAFSPCNVE